MMLESTIIEIDGVFLGAAILLAGSRLLRFHAVHDSVRALHNHILPDLDSLRRKVGQHFRKMMRPPSRAT
ncbi:hypothetical protein AA13595_3237 [Gluconacetobacter johannae DSM 13595]|uniref:Uncharacterized protein n=1 Tax=Gluconacetobacter johannae TaxID=112140 RepID=A0A7W4J826_9PROT|nr:hypothetical protein [Gluconacetobacter johannae]MBB2176433.1 hypothetical protein [Gluconacetobacter johannae]GBQ91970.1 hypothetical protein AA13595_3237 [Gluconacetobacter johannae DSM 13595]